MEYSLELFDGHLMRILLCPLSLEFFLSFVDNVGFVFDLLTKIMELLLHYGILFTKTLDLSVFLVESPLVVINHRNVTHLKI